MIAKRFMLGGRGSGPSRLTGWISIIGMMVGTFAMIISLAVMNGFEERVINKLIGFEGDIRITGINKYAALEQAYNKVKNDASIDKVYDVFLSKLEYNKDIPDEILFPLPRIGIPYYLNRLYYRIFLHSY